METGARKIASRAPQLARYAAGNAPPGRSQEKEPSLGPGTATYTAAVTGSSLKL